jgi:hypothetical protein
MAITAKRLAGRFRMLHFGALRLWAIERATDEQIDSSLLADGECLRSGSAL